MKKIIFLLTFLLLALSNSLALGQLNQNYDFYYNLIGKDMNFVKKNYPDHDQLPDNSPLFPGYYIIGSVYCADGGTVTITVDYLDVKGTKKVRSVGMIMEDCRVDPKKPNDIYDALSMFTYLYGFPFDDENFAKDITVNVENSDTIMMTMSGPIIYGVYKEKFNGKTIFTSGAGTILY